MDPADITELPKRTVLLIDDHPVVALGVKFMLLEHPQLSLVGTAGNASEALRSCAGTTPDAVIVDLVFSGKVDIPLVGRLREKMPLAAIVVFSSLPEQLYARDVLSAGADAYVQKDNDLTRLITVLGEILAKPEKARQTLRTVADPWLLRSGEKPSLDAVRLTPREIEIGRHLSLGLSIVEIARLVGASANTVAVHRDNIRKKLDCRDSTELVARLARFYGAGIA